MITIWKTSWGTATKQKLPRQASEDSSMSWARLLKKNKKKTIIIINKTKNK